MPIVKKYGRVLPALFLAMAGWYCTRLVGVLAKAPFLGGADAYYYALQVKFLVKMGALKIPDFSPLYWLMKWTAGLGMSCEKTVILWTVLLQLIIAINMLIVGKLASGKGNGLILTGIPLFAWAAISPTLAFTCIEFPKFAFALAFLPYWTLGLINKRLTLVSLGAVIISCVSHRALIGIAGLGLAGLALMGCWRMKAAGAKLLILIAGVVALLAAAAINGKYLSLLDFGRLEFHHPLPSLATFMARRETPLALKVEVVAALLLGAGAMAFSWRTRLNRAAVFIWTPFIAFLLVLPLGSREVMGVAERLALTLPLAAMCCWYPLAERLSIGGAVSRNAKIAAVAAFIPLIAAGAMPRVYLRMVHPDRLNPDYALYEEVVKAVAPLKPAMLIAHQGLNSYYVYRTMRDAFPYEPEAHWPKKRIWRVVYGVAPSEWAYFLPGDCLWGGGKLFALPGPYSLIREDCWHTFRQRVALSADQELKDRVLRLWLNPYRKRPAFLYHKHRTGEEDEIFTAMPKTAGK